ncbi:MAG TPA: DUF4162 domain-containing protein, partial [Pyrinomonadaceae bacterium]
EVLQTETSIVAGAFVYAKPNGANIHVANEADIEKILQIVRNSGGKLVSVQPIKQSLEELFVKETK